MHKKKEQLHGSSLFYDEQIESPFSDGSSPLDIHDFTEPSKPPAEIKLNVMTPPEPIKRAQSFLDPPTPLLKLAARSDSLGVD